VGDVLWIGSGNRIVANQNVSDSEYWNDRYLAGETGWDRGRVAPPVARMIDEGVAAGRALLVLGAGRGHEAIYAALKGLDVTAVDFAEAAVETMRLRAAEQKAKLAALERDLFTLPQTHEGQFGAALEHLAFSVVDPKRRPEYAKAVHAVLAPGGIYFGLFFAHDREGGPPFATSEAEVRQLFSPLFEIERLVQAEDSFPSRAGEELELVFRRKP